MLSPWTLSRLYRSGSPVGSGGFHTFLIVLILFLSSPDSGLCCNSHDWLTIWFWKYHNNGSFRLRNHSLSRKIWDNRTVILKFPKSLFILLINTLQKYYQLNYIFLIHKVDLNTIVEFYTLLMNYLVTKVIIVSNVWKETPSF